MNAIPLMGKPSSVSERSRPVGFMPCGAGVRYSSLRCGRARTAVRWFS